MQITVDRGIPSLFAKGNQRGGGGGSNSSEIYIHSNSFLQMVNLLRHKAKAKSVDQQYAVIL